MVSIGLVKLLLESGVVVSVMVFRTATCRFAALIVGRLIRNQRLSLLISIYSSRRL